MPASVHQRVVGQGGLGSPATQRAEPFRQSDHPVLCAPKGKRHGQASHGPIARSNCLGSWSIRLCLGRPRSTPIGSESTQRVLLGALLPTSDVRSLGQRACRNREHRLREPEPEAVEVGWVVPKAKPTIGTEFGSSSPTYTYWHPWSGT